MNETKVVIEVPVAQFGKPTADYVIYNGERRSLKGWNLWQHIQDAMGEVGNAARLAQDGGVLTITLEGKRDTESTDE
jgi:hypothetical protein